MRLYNLVTEILSFVEVFYFFLATSVEERPWRLTQSPDTGRNERLRGEGDQIKFIDLGFQRWQVCTELKYQVPSMGMTENKLALVSFTR